MEDIFSLVCQQVQLITVSCMYQNALTFQRLIFKKSSMNYYRLYSRPRKQCMGCPQIHACEIDCGSIRINASGNYPAFHLKKIHKRGILRAEECLLAAMALNLKRMVKAV